MGRELLTYIIVANIVSFSFFQLIKLGFSYLRGKYLVAKLEERANAIMRNLMSQEESLRILAEQQEKEKHSAKKDENAIDKE